MMYHKIKFKPIITIFIILTICLISSSKAQLHQNASYKFLQLSSNSRSLALGGNQYGVNDNDIHIAFQNPSVINKNMHQHIGFTFTDYFNSVNYGNVGYAHDFKKIGSFTGAIQYIGYGEFKHTDNIGNVLGDFNASEYSFNIGWGRQLDSHFFIGSNVKNIYSSLETYHSYALAVDLAGTYFNKKHNLTVSILLSNIGSQLSSYYPDKKEKLPFQASLGLSKRFTHMPFRYFVTLQHLQKYDLTYEEPELEKNTLSQLSDKSAQEKSKFEETFDKTMRHVVIGGEFTPGKFLAFRFGYNYLRRQELKIKDKLSTVGFSWGLGLNTNWFSLSYSRSKFHLAGSPNQFSLTLRMPNMPFFKKS